jgi:hypothetical protein
MLAALVAFIDEDRNSSEFQIVTNTPKLGQAAEQQHQE